jgi:hypothetical protein
MRAKQPALFVAAILAGLFILAPAQAQDEPKKAAEPAAEKPKEVPPPAAVNKADAAELARAAVAVSEAIGLRRPIESLVGMSAGPASPAWAKLLAAKKGPPPITQYFEKYPVHDGMPVPLWNQEVPESQLYCYLVAAAQRVQRSTFENVARKDIVYEDALEHPEKYRGEVVHVEGILRRLKKIDAPYLAQKYGVDKLYVGWVFDPKNPNLNQPWYVVFSVLPSKFTFKDRPDVRVTVDGYFFKRLRFEVEESWFDAPLVITRTIDVVRELPNDVAYRNRGAAAAVGVAFMGGPIHQAIPLGVGSFNQVWPAVERKAWLEKLPEIATKYDLTPFIILDRQPMMPLDRNTGPDAEPIAFYQLLALAHKMPESALAKGARRDLTFAHFVNQAEKQRGEVVHIEGTLARVRKFDPSKLAKESGITAEYEVWMYDPKNYGANPMVMYVSELPPGIEVKEKTQPLHVKFDGYFFKLYRFETGERTKDGKAMFRVAPLFIGRTLTLEKVEAPPLVPYGKDMLMLFLGVILTTLSVALGAVFFYRRGDHDIRSRVAGASALSFGEPAPESAATAPTPTGADPNEFSGFSPGSSN